MKNILKRLQIALYVLFFDNVGINMRIINSKQSEIADKKQAENVILNTNEKVRDAYLYLISLAVVEAATELTDERIAEKPGTLSWRSGELAALARLRTYIENLHFDENENK